MKRLMFLKALRPFYAVYEGEGTGDADKAAADKAAADKAAADKAAADRKFSQEDVNRLLAEDRRKHKTQVEQTVAQLEEIKKQKGLSEQQVLDLEKRIENLQSSVQTADERTKQQLATRDKEYKASLESASGERDRWKGFYTGEVVKNQILQSALTHKAVRPEQMLELLGPKTRLVEVIDPGDNKTVVGYVPKIKFKDVNDKNEAVELDLTVEDAIKRMKELPDRFGNLFESGISGGLGGTGSAGSGTGDMNLDRTLDDPEAYRKNRKKLGLGRKS